MRLDNFIKRPVLSTVISILTVILGLIGLVSLPIEQYPDVAPPTVDVSAYYTGANAQTVLNSVIVPLEEQINGVLQTGNERRHVPGQRAEPCVTGFGFAAG